MDPFSKSHCVCIVFLLSKGISACKQLLPSFSGILFHALSRGAICFVPAVSFLIETLQQPIRTIYFEVFYLNKKYFKQNGSHLMKKHRINCAMKWWRKLWAFLFAITLYRWKDVFGFTCQFCVVPRFHVTLETFLLSACKVTL